MVLKNHWTRQEIVKALDYYKERVTEPFCVKERDKFLADMAKQINRTLDLTSPINPILDHFTGFCVNPYSLKQVSDIRINEIPYKEITLDDLVFPSGEFIVGCVKIGDMWFDAETYKTTVRGSHDSNNWADR